MVLIAYGISSVFSALNRAKLGLYKTITLFSIVWFDFEGDLLLVIKALSKLVLSHCEPLF